MKTVVIVWGYSMMKTPAEWIHDDETLTDLQVCHWKVLQKKQGFRFSLDAVLLAHFAGLKEGWHICDLGCGCGIIALLLASRAANLSIDGIELQIELADMAARSMALNEIPQIQIHQADLRTLPPSWQDRYDLVVCNPPYFLPGTGKQSPLTQVALAKHELSCTLDEVLASASRLLKSNGRLAIVHRPSRLGQLLTGCAAHHLAPRRLRLVHPTAQKEANLILLEAVKGAKEDLHIEAPLIIYDASGQYSPEAAHYFGGKSL